MFAALQRSTQRVETGHSLRDAPRSALRDEANFADSTIANVAFLLRFSLCRQSNRSTPPIHVGVKPAFRGALAMHACFQRVKS
jgi:hypothetical protein